MGEAEAILDSPRWWLALRREERRPAEAPAGERECEAGRRRLAIWRSERAVTGGLEPDLARWTAGGLGDAGLLALLGEPPESLRDRLPDPPDWLDPIAAAWSAPPDERTATPAVDRTHGLLELVRPLSARYAGILRARLTRLQAAHGDPRTVGAGHPLVRPPAETPLAMVTPVLAVALHRARRAGELRGDTGAERFDDFVRRLADRDLALSLLAAHPVLARELVDEYATWAAVRTELAEQLLADLPALRAAYGLTATSLSDVVEVGFGAGDTHRGGRSVAILTFADGGRVVYKPRSLAVEEHFSALVGWLNGRGLAHPLRRLRVLDRGDHGWVEYVAAAGCADDAGVRRFYWRQGAQLALLHLLRTSDVHLENLIAAGDQPVVVDLEAAFQQPYPESTARPAAVPPEALRLVADSVLAVGLLPQRAVRRDGDELRGLDVSGLAGRGGELTPMAVPRWHDGGTDRMRRGREPVPMPGALNLPTVAGAAVDPVRYRADFVAGFQACYRLLMAHRAELLAPDGPVAAFAGDETRFLVLPTMVYGRILSESWHPVVLRDALDRECLFEVLATRHPRLAHNARVVASECRQIARRDIPYFATSPGSRDLRDDTGPLVRDFFDRTALDLVRDRIAGLSEADLRQQTWTVEASLSALAIGDGVRDSAPRHRPLPAGEIGDDAVRAATRLADNLLDTAFGDVGDRPVWLTLTLVGDRYWTIVPTGYDSFAGLCGIALFLAQLDARLGGGPTVYRRTAEAIAAMLADHLAALDRWPPADRARLGIGGFTDLGGYVHTLVHLGALWGRADLLDRAHLLVPELTARVAGDRHLDVVFGAAGAALAVRALHALAPTGATRAALLAIGDHLLGAATPHGAGIGWTTPIPARAPLTGFSHGAAGIGYALAEIGRWTGEERFVAGAAAAVRFEHGAYDPRRGAWPDHRTTTPEGGTMDAWCHGAAGIGLARAATADLLTGPEARADLAAAVDAVRRDLLPRGALAGVGDDSLCHGDLGLAETLLSAGRATGDGGLVRLARRCGQAVAEAVLAGAERCGVPRGLHVPGLLMGVAGIGYGLLRLADPDRVPNVLLLEPPTPEEEPCPACP